MSDYDFYAVNEWSDGRSHTVATFARSADAENCASRLQELSDKHIPDCEYHYKVVGHFLDTGLYEVEERWLDHNLYLFA